MFCAIASEIPDPDGWEYQTPEMGADEIEAAKSRNAKRLMALTPEARQVLLRRWLREIQQ